MKQDLKTQLSDIKLDYNNYGHLPARADIVVISNSQEGDNGSIVLKQWETLNYLRTQIKALDEYLQTNKGEIFSDWICSNKVNFNETATKKIGGYNNSTGGILAYFLNLQKLYNEEEEKYDLLEIDSTIPEYFKGEAINMQEQRLVKREGRRKTSKVQFRDMKKDKKGYFYVKLDEPEIEPETTAKAEDPVKKDEKIHAVDSGTTSPEPININIKEKKSNAIWWVTGIVSAVALVVIVIIFSGKGNQKT